MTHCKTPISFTKMHGLGNDFVVLDSVRQPLLLTAGLIQQMADRHLGIGFDQLLLIESPRQAGVDFAYRIFNADGSEVGQCGNGARCVGRFLLDTGLISSQQASIALGTLQRKLQVCPQPDGQMAVNMGVPVLEPAEIPFQAPATGVRYYVKVGDVSVAIGAVSMGNPHAVLWVNDIDTAPVATLGKQLASHARFPEGVNVGFAQRMHSGQIRLRVYERGAGETLACGSGACAAVVVGCMQNMLDAEVEVILPGGKLHVTWLGGHHPVWMVGPAETVFKGEWFGR